MIRQTKNQRSIGVPPMARPRRGGFTLLEMLVVVFIVTLLISVLLVGVFRAKKAATVIRTKDDLQLISTALNAYRDEFGEYPQFASPATDQATVTAGTTAGSGLWLDYSDRRGSGVCTRGAVLLCRALLGPGQANTDPTPANGAYPGDDCADGLGFRVRRTYNATTGTFSGKVYGPYIDASKFKIGYLAVDSTYASNAAFPMAYPVILDGNGNPILYFPATPGSLSTTGYPVGNLDPALWNPTNPLLTDNFRFNWYDNSGVPSPMPTPPIPTPYPQNPMSYTTMKQLAQNAGPLPYLLWTAGADGVFGFDNNGKTDDIANFDLPDSK